MKPRLPYVVSAILTTAAIALMISFATHAGALWRDEANSAAMAQAFPHLRWLDLQFDSFPAGWPLILGIWTHVAGSSDTSYRVFGLLIGLAILAAMWLAAPQHKPGVALALVALNGGAIRTFCSIRGYGLAILAALLLIAALRARRHGLVLLASLACVHLMYQNCVVVFAAITAAIVVACSDRRYRDAIMLASAGAIAALSMLIYVPVIRASQTWIEYLQGPFDLGRFRDKTIEAIAFAGRASLFVWIAVVIAVVIVIAIRRRAVLFPATLLLLLVPGTWLLLRQMAFPTAWWYYVPLLTIAAVAIDEIANQALVALAIGALFFVPSLHTTTLRQTNIDTVADAIARSATKNDFIVLSDWREGVAYDRYHHAAAPWQTVPPLSFHAWHRWDEAASNLHDDHAMDPLLNAIRDHLLRGDRVFVAGTLLTHPPAGRRLPVYRGTIFANELRWRIQWENELAANGKLRRERPGDADINPYENFSLQVWQASSARQVLSAE